MKTFFPDWPAPQSVKACITTRAEGSSQGPYASGNVALHVGDKREHVEQNRRALCQQLPSGATVPWLEQVHGTDIVPLREGIELSAQARNADGVFSDEKHQVCLVQTADCLPVLLCDKSGLRVAAVHAGWRGLAAGIISKAVKQYFPQARYVMAYLGPAISQPYFEVGSSVLKAFLCAETSRKYAEPVQRSFEAIIKKPLIDGPDAKYHADLYRLARSELRGVGVHDIYGGQYCTYGDNRTFFSYRRDGVTGRMASLIWLE